MTELLLALAVVEPRKTANDAKANPEFNPPIVRARQRIEVELLSLASAEGWDEPRAHEAISGALQLIERNGPLGKDRHFAECDEEARAFLSHVLRRCDIAARRAAGSDLRHEAAEVVEKIARQIQVRAAREADYDLEADDDDARQPNAVRAYSELDSLARASDESSAGRLAEAKDAIIDAEQARAGGTLRQARARVHTRHTRFRQKVVAKLRERHDRYVLRSWESSDEEAAGRLDTLESKLFELAMQVVDHRYRLRSAGAGAKPDYGGHDT